MSDFSLIIINKYYCLIILIIIILGCYIKNMVTINFGVYKIVV